MTVPFPLYLALLQRNHYEYLIPVLLTWMKVDVVEIGVDWIFYWFRFDQHTAGYSEKNMERKKLLTTFFLLIFATRNLSPNVHSSMGTRYTDLFCWSHNLLRSRFSFYCIPITQVSRLTSQLCIQLPFLCQSKNDQNLSTRNTWELVLFESNVKERVFFLFWFK